ncbi:MAG: hypothetical protein COX57_13140 [Alphaproteobacteria bacterium CG_4_10_14_0_2_um_filter_63_37]|nr:MAG: hypothetical protein AUJ55_04455 [Proteobacteria bacterium CG1_02_64_396]PJA23529.1 MAG: hypothetical protein COX57_13140 [Alphaproteobacteria bacterium CG_4_10_14_0_2_um_filter_63_37]
MSEREVQRVIRAQEMAEGAGVTVRRAIGTQEAIYLDPFLLLDEAFIPSGTGFPPHPHRGFQAVSYVLAGAMAHEDSAGNVGTLHPGDLQLMVAGKGIVHSEMPVGDATTHGIQLWINLPPELKACEPRYQDHRAAEVPEVLEDTARIKVICGSYDSTPGPAQPATPFDYFDVALDTGGFFHHRVAPQDTVLIYMLEGGARFGLEGHPVLSGDLAEFGPGTDVVGASPEGCRFLLLAGAKIGAPIVRRGPYVD